MISTTYQEAHFCLAPGIYVKVKYHVKSGTGHLSCRHIPGKRPFTHVKGEILPHRIAVALATEFAGDHKEVAALAH